ncbi:MAG: hypothetical protein HOM11_13830 [Methylococcales bacterium]|nr:hypothetical protein [Methylococcales bacterium]MBT7443220.1 hypothetical protein [Methylococcales bacterium]
MVRLLALLALLSSLATHAAIPCGALTPSSHPKQYQTLLLLSNANTLQSLQEIPDRLNRISLIFARHGDRRGLFPTLYTPVSQVALQYIQQQPRETRNNLSTLMRHLTRAYFKNLNQHLLGRKLPSYWQLYYQTSFNCHANPILTTSYAILAHLSFDLKIALLKSNISDGFFPEYLQVGNALARTARSSSHLLWRRYKLNILPLFEGLWAGKTLKSNSRTPNLSTILTFNAIRTEAWMSSRAQHYSMGMLDGMISKGQLMLWETRVKLLFKMSKIGVY